MLNQIHIHLLAIVHTTTTFACYIALTTWLCLLCDTSCAQTIVIDPGHGGRDPGKPHSNANFAHEKDLNLSIAKKTAKYLRESLPKARIILTRNEDTYLSLENRVLIADSAKADIFVSIHCNSSENKYISGAEAHIHTPKRTDSKRLAECFAAVFAKTSTKWRGIIDALQRGKSLYLTKYPKSASVLLELGYMTNATEESYLNSEEGQSILSKAIARGCVQYLRLKIPRSNLVIYKVQIITVSQALAIGNKLFEAIEERIERYENPNNNKTFYLVGHEYDYTSAQVLKNKLKKLGFEDAFVVEVR